MTTVIAKPFDGNLSICLPEYFYFDTNGPAVGEVGRIVSFRALKDGVAYIGIWNEALCPERVALLKFPTELAEDIYRLMKDRRVGINHQRRPVLLTNL